MFKLDNEGVKIYTKKQMQTKLKYFSFYLIPQPLLGFLFKMMTLLVLCRERVLILARTNIRKHLGFADSTMVLFRNYVRDLDAAGRD